MTQPSQLQALLIENDVEFEFLRDCGFLKQPHKISISDVDDIIQTVCTEFLLKRSAAEIQQFIDGLNALDIGRLIKSHPTQFKELFVYNSKVVTPHDLDILFLPILSPSGSNAREREEAVVLNWKDYIYESEGKTVAMRGMWLIFSFYRMWSYSQ